MGYLYGILSDIIDLSTGGVVQVALRAQGLSSDLVLLIL